MFGLNKLQRGVLKTADAALRQGSVLGKRALGKPPTANTFISVDPFVARGNAPTSAAKFDQLLRKGVGAELDLRLSTPGVSKKRDQIKYFNVGWLDGTPPTQKRLEEIMDVMGAWRAKQRLAGGTPQQMYVHCRAGKGRTGVVIACYQIRFNGMDVEKAIAQAKAGGMSKPWQERAIRKFAENEAARAF